MTINMAMVRDMKRRTKEANLYFDVILVIRMRDLKPGQNGYNVYLKVDE